MIPQKVEMKAEWHYALVSSANLEKRYHIWVDGNIIVAGENGKSIMKSSLDRIMKYLDILNIFLFILFTGLPWKFNDIF